MHEKIRIKDKKKEKEKEVTHPTLQYGKNEMEGTCLTLLKSSLLFHLTLEFSLRILPVNGFYFALN